MQKLLVSAVLFGSASALHVPVTSRSRPITMGTAYVIGVMNLGC